MSGSNPRTGAWHHLESPLRVGAAALLLAAPLAAQASSIGGSDLDHDDPHLQHLLLQDDGAHDDLHANLLKSLEGHLENPHLGPRFDPPDWLDFRLRRPITDWLGLSGVSDTGIVMTAALLLFMLPSGDAKQPRLMTWEDVTRLPWGVLILFGGGLSLAAAVSGSGLALWLGELLAPLNAWGTAVLVVASVAMVIFLTELTSNLATTATLLPVMGAIAIQAGVPPIVLTVPITIAASCAFMLPVATPPNAIVFSTGAISIPQMVRAGIFLNLIGIVIVSIAALVLAPGLLS